MRYKITFSYDGTHYGGWQVQANSLAIQPLVQKALETVLRHPLDLSGSGRTDAGVHALAQTAHFDSDVLENTGRARLSVNALLPPDIRVQSIEPTQDTFHARYSAQGKIYHYHLHLDPVMDPFVRLYRHHVFGRFDLNRLQEGAKQLLGTHDFLSFANHRGVPCTDSIRTLKRLDAVLQKGGIRLEFEGDGFLYKMVRNLVGTLLEIAAHKRSPNEIPEILAAKDRTRAGGSAPPQGLFLVQVLY
jgi:tRNA pseudouridine38-40 synthase